MAENDKGFKSRTNNVSNTFQEAAIVHQSPISAHTTGIVPLPLGSRGPRSLYLKRHGGSFGFTLRHFIVYPPDGIETSLDRQAAAVGALNKPMDTIFVKNVAARGPAHLSGLQKGDRIVAVNGVPVVDRSYAQVVHLIQHGPDYLHLLVVPKEEDVLQKFFADAAHNPISNQLPKQQQEQLIYPHLNPNPYHDSHFQVDVNSWKSLQEPTYTSIDYDRLGRQNIYSRTPHQLQQHQQQVIRNNSREQHSHKRPPQEHQKHIYAELCPDDSIQRPKAQPQVPLYRKMGRRASEGNVLYDPDYCENPRFVNGNEMAVNSLRTKCDSVVNNTTSTMPVASYVNSAAYRLSLDGGRRESSSSLGSSFADGSKDSLSSFDSTSTLTGHETDDSVIMNRLRRNFQQKEEFLRSKPIEVIQREFYGRPKKLEKPMWPPNETDKQNMNSQKNKMDVDKELDYITSTRNGGGGGNISSYPQQKGVTSPKENLRFTPESAKPQEGSVAPTGLMDSSTGAQESASTNECIETDKRMPLPNLQMVSKRAKQFESGKPLPEDDPMANDRTSFYKSELARLSNKRVVPNVTDRAHEFESRASSLEPRRDPSGSSTNSFASTKTTSENRRVHRDSRSLESSGSTTSVCSDASQKLSGNVSIPIGGKYIHVPPPADYVQKDVPDVENSVTRQHMRSNSADSWASAVEELPPLSKSESLTKQAQEKVSKTIQEAMEGMPSLIPKSPPIDKFLTPQSPPPLIPEPVEDMHTSSQPSSPKSPPIRPNHLTLPFPVRPARKHGSASTRSLSPAYFPNSDQPVVLRRKKHNDLTDEDKIVRRESYLKATGSGRMYVDEDEDNASPISHRHAHRKWRPPLFPGDIQQLRKLFEEAASSLGGSTSEGSSGNVSLERDKSSYPSSPLDKDRVIKEGPLQCKIAEIDGKRAADRSWKQVWAVLRGPRLYFYKERNHQSPSDSADQTLSNGVDMRASCVRVAEDYTKRKHVLRVSSALPCRSEILLQADNTLDLADWVKALQEQVAATTDVEEKIDPLSSPTKQQAVPQQVPASTTIQVQGSSQSPVSKTRKSLSHSAIDGSGGAVGPVSPKPKTWRGRMVKQIRKIQGASSPSSPVAPEGSTFGVPLEQCYPSYRNQYIPRIVEVCTEIVENKGLETIGIYRVPGNNAAITALTNAVNQCYDGVPSSDSHWNDIHVVSSLLKSFFRKLPDALLTKLLYSKFIEADKIENPYLRMQELKKVVNQLPPHHYHTLKHLMLHLKKVTDKGHINKMEGKNLAIVFGPTLFRTSEDDMATMVNDINHNYRIVESLICHADWFFSEDPSVPLNLGMTSVPTEETQTESEMASSKALLLDNISKIENLKDQKEKKEILSSIISAAHRKVMRKTMKSVPSSQEMKEDSTTTENKEFTYQSNVPSVLKENNPSAETKTRAHIIPTTVVDMEKPPLTSSSSQSEKVPWFNYSADQENFRRRIENFIQETQANLQRSRKTELYANPSLENFLASLPGSNFSSAGSNSIYTVPAGNGVQYENVPVGGMKINGSDVLKNKGGVYRVGGSNINNNNNDNVTGRQRITSSMENVHRAVIEAASNSANANVKKIRYGNENDLNQRSGSLDSIHKINCTDEGNDLQASIMEIFDKKKKMLNPLAANDDQVHDTPKTQTTCKQLRDSSQLVSPSSPKLYRNPSLHKSVLAAAFNISELPNDKDDKSSKESDVEEKDKDSTDGIPDNDKDITKKKKCANFEVNASKLKRSESLNKPERSSSVSVPGSKLKRSESLNKTPSERSKKHESLTKHEKTESNLNKRREQLTRRGNKEVTKLKRKNGMPERSIKRRHTVGGTKDFDKVSWLDNRHQQEKSDAERDSITEKTSSLRTSSPDLSSTRRERLFFEVSLVGPENMVVALRQHLIGARPQSLPEPTMFTVPLESHV
ncbi:rho GTPase-activating protein 21 isoform X1 [Agrilus planipennis]|uniref:Rho GTPase-activating protein 21 isoform X1 n=1 Tax=Agrilus planipennis TaxID=224129 RepID=A0A7F5REU9_AGRPL|nr:rho GTPase-activating protein 21 isoform X1 [Agrilus planipennis]